MDPVTEVVQAAQACSLGPEDLAVHERAMVASLQQAAAANAKQQEQQDLERRQALAQCLLEQYKQEGGHFIYNQSVDARDLDWFVADQRSKGMVVEYKFCWGRCPGLAYRPRFDGIHIHITTDGDRAGSASVPSSKTDCACESPASS